MKEKGLIFSAESIRAMLAGTKTRTSRLRGLQAVNAAADRWQISGKCFTAQEGDSLVNFFDKRNEEIGFVVKCPWQVGDVIYTKETWGTISSMGIDGYVVYKESYDGDKDIRWKSPMFMSRNVTRPELFLTITGITCGRIGKISEEEAFEEGIKNGDWLGDPVGEFRKVWNFFHAKPKPVRGNSEWAKALDWNWINNTQPVRGATKDDIVGYISFPFPDEDGDHRTEIRGRPHFRCANPFAWRLTFTKKGR